MGSNYINTDFQFKLLLASKAECMGGICSFRCLLVQEARVSDTSFTESSLHTEEL